jgi:hypothetical protein
LRSYFHSAILEIETAMEIACDSKLLNRRYDADGRLHILRTPISKATVNPYYGREIPDADKLGLEPERVYYLLRDPGELAKAAPSFARNQLMFVHTPVSADDPKQDSIAGTIGSDVEFQAPYLIADLCIWDVEAIAGVETDTVRELSASYRYRADMTPGMYEGQRYDGVMRDIQGNHVALVKSGRAGADVMAADNELETKMETKFGKALYAILCAASPKLAADAALKPMVIGLTRKQCDLRALEPKLLAMDAELRKPETLAAMQAAKDAESEEETEAEKKAREEKEKAAKDKKAKDRKTAKDLSFEEWAKEEEGESDHKAKDGEEETLEEKKKRYEREKRRADDSEEESEEERKERMEKRAKDKKAKDCSAEDGMKKAMDEFKADLRSADEARRAVRPVVGDVLAQDSAEGIYGFALDQMKVDRSGVTGVPALRALFNLAHQASKPAAHVAFDSSINVEEKFTGAGRQIQVM